MCHRHFLDALSILVLVTLAACDHDVPTIAALPQSDINAKSQTLYRITDLGSLGGDSILAWRISGRGQIIGWGTMASGITHAFTWTANRGVIDLGAMGAGNASAAWGINDEGVVVGEIDLPSGSTRAFRWTALEGMRDLGTLGGDVALAEGINDAGEVVGYTNLVVGGPTHGFAWTVRGGMKDAGALDDANTRLRSIDEFGKLGTGTGQGQAVLWTRAAGFRGIGFLPGGGYSYGARINDRSQIAGFSDTDISTHAFRWTQSTGMVDLGALSGASGRSEALDIANSGAIVGATTTQADPAHLHAFLWMPDRGMRLLNSLTAAVDDEAYGLNELGQIVGYADSPDGRRHALLWTPRER